MRPKDVNDEIGDGFKASDYTGSFDGVFGNS